jgi:hypothetical protein
LSFLAARSWQRLLSFNPAPASHRPGVTKPLDFNDVPNQWPVNAESM